MKQIIDFLAWRKEAAKMAPVYAKPRPGEIHRIVLSPEKIQQDLGWTPHVPSKTGWNKPFYPFVKPDPNHIQRP